MSRPIGRTGWLRAAPVLLALAAVGAGAWAQPAPRASYVYTLNNDPERNAVVVFERQANGGLALVAGSPFPAGGRGLAGDDFDEQGAVRVHGEHLLAVNPGSDSIAVFRRLAGGRLEPVAGSPFPSGGAVPLSLAVRGDLVYVANQAPPFVRRGAAPNLTGFRMSSDGRLTPVPNSTISFSPGQGPAQVEFSPGGETLVVTAGFQEAATSRVRSFRVQGDGTLKEGPGSPLATPGASGPVGFSWDPNRSRVYVSNFRGSAITVFDVDPATAALKQVGGPNADGETAACWTAISRDGKTLYVANFVSNSISVFTIEPDGRLQLLGSRSRRGATRPDTKDIELSADGRFLYAIASSGRQIAVFRIGEDRLPQELPAGSSPIPVGSGQLTTGLAVER